MCWAVFDCFACCGTFQDADRCLDFFRVFRWLGSFFSTRLGPYVWDLGREDGLFSDLEKGFRGGKRGKTLVQCVCDNWCFWALERVATTEHSFTGWAHCLTKEFEVFTKPPIKIHARRILKCMIGTCSNYTCPVANDFVMCIQQDRTM